MSEFMKSVRVIRKQFEEALATGVIGVMQLHKMFKERGLEPIPNPDEKPWWWKKTITRNHGKFDDATQSKFEHAYYDHHMAQRRTKHPDYPASTGIRVSGLRSEGGYPSQAEAKKRFQSGVDRPSPGHPALQEFDKGGAVKRKPRSRKLHKGGALLFGMKK